MNSRKLIIALASAALLAAGFGAAVMPASAQERTLLVRLVDGTEITVTVDVPPGTPVSAISIPGVNAPIASVTDITPAPAPAPAPKQSPEAPKDQPGSTQPSNPGGQGGGEQGSGGGGGGGGQDGASGGGSGDGKSGGGKKSPSKGGSGGGGGGAGGGGAGGGDRASGQGSNPRAKPQPKRRRSGATRTPGGQPTINNPSVSLASPGPAPIGVPNFFIDKFKIPPFLLSIYQAAGIEYGVPWQVLAAINEIETDYGRNLNVSSAGALGWMQFMPPSWKAYGVDANGDGVKDPYNPVDAIFAAGRYLRAAGADKNLRKAIFAYNHADWYVDSVLLRARVIGGMPDALVGSLTGMTQGIFPVHAKARYADDITARERTRRATKGGNAAYLVSGQSNRRGINIYAKPGSPVVAVNDAVVKKIGNSPRLGRYMIIEDVYGNRYTYGNLKKVAKHYPAPKEREISRSEIARELKLPRRDPKPNQAASAGKQRPAKARTASSRKANKGRTARSARRVSAPSTRSDAKPNIKKERLFAHPKRPRSAAAGGAEQMLRRGGKVEGFTEYSAYFTRVFGLDRDDVELKRLRVGSRVIAGTILGRIGTTSATADPHVHFEIRPAGKGAPRIDPKPLLDGWKLLETTAIYRAAGRNPFFGSGAKNPSIGQILLMSKETLERRVVANPRIKMYDCGRRDVRGGQIDRRVLATLEFLAASGFRPGVSSLKCGRTSSFTASGNVSHHASGNAVDIATLNDMPVLGNQGKGSITEMAVRRLMTLQGTLKPAQIITLMKFEGAPNTIAMSDHHDHIHVGFQPHFRGDKKLGRQMDAVLKPNQWIKLVDRLNEIDNPVVRRKPSKHAIKVKRASRAHRGE
jgi:murein DD-endopeptidase MepM/ murein hydrolase activator NlpD